MLALKSQQHEHDQIIHNLNIRLKESQERENKLQERIQAITVIETSSRDKFNVSEKEFARKLEEYEMRERILNDKIKQLISQLNESKHRVMKEDDADISHDNISFSRHKHQSSPNNSYIATSICSTSEQQMLQDEIESLRCVLELKQTEITELRKDNQQLRNVHDELTKEQIKVCGLESRVEDLEIQLKNKFDSEK